MSASAAARKAGFTGDVARNASITLLKRENIKAAMAELRDKMAEKTELTLERYLDSLELGRKRSDDLEQMQAAKGYSELIGKAQGYLTERYHLTVSTVDL